MTFLNFAEAIINPFRQGLADLFCLGIINLLSPTVRFFFREEDLKSHFEDDPLMLGSARRTRVKIGEEHLGLDGLLQQACTPDAQHRISKNPIKSLWGLVQLINPIGIALLLYTALYLKKTNPSKLKLS